MTERPKYLGETLYLWTLLYVGALLSLLSLPLGSERLALLGVGFWASGVLGQFWFAVLWQRRKREARRNGDSAPKEG